MSKRLNDLLIGKIRHNLKTHLNIVCGFSELLLEELEDIAGALNDDGLEALASMVESAVVWRAMVMVVAMLVAVAGMVAEAAIWAVGADAWVEVLD